jgi:hypothetical protein
MENGVWLSKEYVHQAVKEHTEEHTGNCICFRCTGRLLRQRALTVNAARG